MFTAASIALLSIACCAPILARACPALLPDASVLPHALSRLAFYICCAVVVRAVNRTLNRLVRNHGFSASKPTWSLVRGQGDIVLVTGGSSGIGLELVRLLSKKTANVVSLDFVRPAVEPVGYSHYDCDITDPEAVAAAACRIRAEIGHPTNIFNNAGLSHARTILETDAAQFLTVYKVNVVGALNVLKEFLPHVVSINRGHIVTTASSAAYVAPAQTAAYACSKAASLALHEALGQELVHRYNSPNVRTSIVLPAKVETKMGALLSEPSKPWLTPVLSAESVARRMVEIVESGLSQHVVMPTFVGLTLPLVRAFPDWFGHIIHKGAKSHLMVTGERKKEQSEYTTATDLFKKHGLNS